MEEIFKAFRHLSREIIIYILPGFLLFLDVIIILFVNNCSILQNEIFVNSIFWIAIFMSYIFGHLSISLCVVLKKLCCFDNCFGYKNERLDKEIQIFKKDKDRYEYFIERYNLLHAIRKNVTAIWLIICILNISMLLYSLAFNTNEFAVFYAISIGIAFVSMLLFGLNTQKTKCDYKERIEKLWELNK